MKELKKHFYISVDRYSIAGLQEASVQYHFTQSQQIHPHEEPECHNVSSLLGRRGMIHKYTPANIRSANLDISQ
jgi:hypothetical protein